jgi:hypothetical protein
MAALCCCVLVAGCGAIGPVIDEFKFTNPLGSPFRNEQELFNQIPIGTPVENVPAVMRAHGFELWCSQRQADRLALTYHAIDFVQLCHLFKDTWVTIYLDCGKVVDADVGHELPTPTQHHANDATTSVPASAAPR